MPENHELYQQHGGEARGYLARRCPDGAADDLLQETFLQVARQPARMAEVTMSRAWLFGIARDLLARYFRAMKLPRPERMLFFFQRIALAAGCGFVLLLAGCDPENIICWSPDGARALVFGSDETYLVDGEGKIIGIAPDAREWMPDSRRVIAVRKVQARNWAEVASLLGQERTQSVVRAAGELAILIRGYHGDWSKFFDTDAGQHWFDSQLNVGEKYTGWDASFPLLFLPFYYLQEHDAESVALLMKMISKEEQQQLAIILKPTVSELLVKSAFPENPAAEQVLLRTVDPIGAVRPSPNGKGIAVVVDEPIRPGLYLIPTEGGDRVPVDSGASDADWTPDGQWLTYEKTSLSYDALGDQMLLGTITRCKVCNDEGRFLPKVENPQGLAGVLFAKGTNRVACLPDGRVLFSGFEVGLPMVAPNFAGKMKLFALRLGETPKIEKIVTDEAAKRLPDRIDFFSLSPDGAHVAIPGNQGEVAIVSIETGKVQEIQGRIEMPEKDHRANQKENLDFAVPSWRNATEFSYVRPAGKPGSGPKRAEVVLRSLDGAPRVISATWTDEMTDSFLMRPKVMTAEALSRSRGTHSATGAKPECR
jgi:hypothetical protein